MDNIKYRFIIDNTKHEMKMIFIEGTNGKPFLFGTKNDKQAINIKDFFLSLLVFSPITRFMRVTIEFGSSVLLKNKNQG